MLFKDLQTMSLIEYQKPEGFLMGREKFPYYCIICFLPKLLFFKQRLSQKNFLEPFLLVLSVHYMASLCIVLFICHIIFCTNDRFINMIYFVILYICRYITNKHVGVLVTYIFFQEQKIHF